MIMKGPSNIARALVDLPKSRHNLGSFVVDSWEDKIADGFSVLMVFVNGEFDEQSGHTRSFSRSFVLIPATPNSEAQRAGFPTEIVSDQLRLTGLQKKQGPAPTVILASSSSSTSGGLPPIPASLLSGQVVALMNATRLKDFAAVELLEMVGNDYDRAIQKFQELYRSGSVPTTSMQ